MKRARWARQSQAVDSAMTRAAGSRPIPGNRVTPLIDGEAAYAAMRAAIVGAREWIHFENYIIRSDEVGWQFAELLAARAKEGVTVRVLYDWLGSLGTSRRYWRFLPASRCARSIVSTGSTWSASSAGTTASWSPPMGAGR